MHQPQAPQQRLRQNVVAVNGNMSYMGNRHSIRPVSHRLSNNVLISVTVGTLQKSAKFLGMAAASGTTTKTPGTRANSVALQLRISQCGLRERHVQMQTIASS
jgi:hypothetical protein